MLWSRLRRLLDLVLHELKPVDVAVRETVTWFSRISPRTYGENRDLFEKAAREAIEKTLEAWHERPGGARKSIAVCFRPRDGIGKICITVLSRRSRGRIYAERVEIERYVGVEPTASRIYTIE